MNYTNLPRVPDELQDRLHEPHVLEVIDRWQSRSLDDALGCAPSAEPFDIGGSFSKAVVISPGGFRNGHVRVLALPYQQTWKPSTILRAGFDHDINNPDGMTIVLPNNSVEDQYYELTSEDRARLSQGDMRPFYEKQTRLLEAVAKRLGSRAAKWTLAGYSLGGLTALGIAATGSSKLDFRAVASCEAPNVPRTPKQLRQDFMHSGGWFDQRRAIDDARMPALDQALSPGSMALDYLRFGLASARKDNKALSEGMANPRFNLLVRKALDNHDLTIDLSHVEGSSVFKRAFIAKSPGRVLVTEFTGAGSRRHSTVDNIVAHALMLAA